MFLYDIYVYIYVVFYYCFYFKTLLFNNLRLINNLI